MESVLSSSLRFRLLAVAIVPVVLFLGFTQLRGMPVDVLPEFSPPYVEIQTEALGLSADEVEQFITVPLEANLLSGVAWLDKIESESVPGLSSIVLLFEPGTDIMNARQMVQERLTQAHALPRVSKPPAMIQPLSSASRVMMIGLGSKKLSLIDLSVLARWTIRPRLMGVPGVANVAIWGQRERQLQVQVDPKRLQKEGVSLDQVITTTGNALWVSPLSFLKASTPGTGGFIDTPNQRLGIRHVLPITTAEDLAKVSVEGSTKRLGDVANVVEDHQPLIGDAVTNDGAGLILVVEKFPGSNTLEVTRGVEGALEAMRPGLAGVDMDSTMYRPASFIETSIDNLTMALLIASVLVLLVLVAFFRSWRRVLITAVAIPVSLVAAGIVLYLLGAPVNTMVVAGFVLAIGLVVDDAVIDIENIVRRLRQSQKEGSDRPTVAIVTAAALEVRSPILFATLIVLVSLLPLFVVDGLLGAFLQPVAISYALAIVASMIVALTVTPALAVLLLGNAPLDRRESPLVRSLQRQYGRLVSPIVQRPRLALVGLAALAIVGLAVTPLLQRAMVPTFQERDLLIQWDGAAGTSRPEMNRIAADASQELRSIPGVRRVGGHVGRAVLSDEVVNVNSGSLWVSVDPAADYGATVAAIQDVVDGYPGLRLDVRTYLEARMADAQVGETERLTVRVYGPDASVLRSKAEEVRQALSGVDGIVDASVELAAEEPQVEVEVDIAAAQRYGVKPGDVRRAAATLLSGVEVGSLFEEQKVFDVVVWGVPEIRQSLTSVQELLIETPSGTQVRLADLAAVRVVPGASVISREGISRRIDVGANVKGRDLGAVAADVERALQTVEFPLEYHPELLGEYAERQAVQNRMIGFGLAAVVGIFLLLQAAFGSWRLATVAFLTLPSALVGGILAAYLGGGLITLGSLVGFFTVLGIAARNGIMLINHYQHLETVEGEVFGPDLVLRGARERLSPILMTASATALALVPLVVAGQVPGHEIEHPMAVVILGGLVTSTVLNLLIVPALYLRFGKGWRLFGSEGLADGLRELAPTLAPETKGASSASMGPSSRVPARSAGSGSSAAFAVRVGRPLSRHWMIPAFGIAAALALRVASWRSMRVR
jgi:CzcA family heavy metal efflux pump